jgi:hypothetical protein
MTLEIAKKSIVTIIGTFFSNFFFIVGEWCNFTQHHYIIHYKICHIMHYIIHYIMHYIILKSCVFEWNFFGGVRMFICLVHFFGNVNSFLCCYKYHYAVGGGCTDGRNSFVQLMTYRRTSFLHPTDDIQKKVLHSSNTSFVSCSAATSLVTIEAGVTLLSWCDRFLVFCCSLLCCGSKVLDCYT